MKPSTMSVPFQDDIDAGWARTAERPFDTPIRLLFSSVGSPLLRGKGTGVGVCTRTPSPPRSQSCPTAAEAVLGNALPRDATEPEPEPPHPLGVPRPWVGRCQPDPPPPPPLELQKKPDPDLRGGENRGPGGRGAAPTYRAPHTGRAHARHHYGSKVSSLPCFLLLLFFVFWPLLAREC